MPAGRIRPVAIARAHVVRASGAHEFHYSVEKVPPWQVRRLWKLRKHLRFMKREDSQWL